MRRFFNDLLKDYILMGKSAKMKEDFTKAVS